MPITGSSIIANDVKSLCFHIHLTVEVALSERSFSCLESRECSTMVIRKGYLGQTTTARKLFVIYDVE